MDVFLIPSSTPTSYTMVTHYRSIGDRIPRQQAVALCRGEARILDNRGKHAQTALKALEYMLNQAASSQIRHVQVQGATPATRAVEPNDIDKGYDFIMKESPPDSGRPRSLTLGCQADNGPTFTNMRLAEGGRQRGHRNFAPRGKPRQDPDIHTDHFVGVRTVRPPISEGRHSHIEVEKPGLGRPTRLGKNTIAPSIGDGDVQVLD